MQGGMVTAFYRKCKTQGCAKDGWASTGNPCVRF